MAHDMRYSDTPNKALEPTAGSLVGLVFCLFLVIGFSPLWLSLGRSAT